MHRNEGCKDKNKRPGKVFIISFRCDCRLKQTMVSLYIADDMSTNLEKKDQEIDDLKNSIIKKDDGNDYFGSFVFID